MAGNAKDRPVAVALLGAGYISDFHYNALRVAPNVEVKAICDLNLRLAEQFAQANGIPAVYGNLDEMLAKEALDVVHVLTPPHIHYKTSSQILAAGVDAFIEKPLCHRVSDCQALQQEATAQNRLIGVSHNFLYFPVYEQLVADLRSGRLGRIDQIDIVWNKELGQLKGGPYGAWMLQNPKNILFEVAPHSFVHLVHLIGQPDSIAVDVQDRVELPRGLEFYRRWEIRGWQGNTSIRMRFSFIDGFPEHYIHIRGSNAVARVDFETNTYTCQEHTPYMLDVDRFLNVVNPARATIAQATQTLSNFVLSKMKLSKVGGPFQYSITRAVEDFYRRRGDSLDERLSPQLGESAIALAEWIARETHLPAPAPAAEMPQPIASPTQPATVLVLGGTGFIGRALVRQLCAAGYGVRLLTRDPNSCPADLRQLGIDLVKGDFNDTSSLAAALEGIEYVYHLARGNGKTWTEYLQYDVEPTQRLAELCLAHQIKRFIYTSSIAIYYAGQSAGTITEATPPHPGIMRTAPYARSKAENEKRLLALYEQKGLPVVIFRPGIVLGSGGDPAHWGIAAWPYSSVCRLWGNGDNKLPIVLVEDVADALVKALTAEQIDGETFNLTSPACITANEYLNEFEQQAHLKLKRVPVSGQKEYVEALGKWVIKSIGRDPNAAFPSYADCEGRGFAATFDASKAEQKLGWSPVKDREQLIQDGIHVPVKEFYGQA